jgi:hypothetical protein
MNNSKKEKLKNTMLSNAWEPLELSGRVVENNRKNKRSFAHQLAQFF